ALAFDHVVRRGCPGALAELHAAGGLPVQCDRSIVDSSVRLPHAARRGSVALQHTPMAVTRSILDEAAGSGRAGRAVVELPPAEQTGRGSGTGPGEAARRGVRGRVTARPLDGV